MKKTALFYWPKKGNVASCALKIEAQFEKDNIDTNTIKAIDEYDLNDYSLIIVGGSTVGADHWEKATKNNFWHSFFTKIKQANHTGKPIAIFGLGDQILYPDHFVDGMKLIKDEIEGCGARLIGKWPTEGYEFTNSDSIEDNMFLGLALDEDQQPELTDERIKNWVQQIKEEAAL
ncbi:MAG: flavodoxin [Bacteroidales bacterium]|nr:flavodoxin [Bacteroidales bacterium]